jgi:hypothetical protein
MQFPEINCILVYCQFENITSDWYHDLFHEQDMEMNSRQFLWIGVFTYGLLFV